MEKKSYREMILVVLKAMTVAMGVAVVALSCMGGLEMRTTVTLLGIGLACAGVALMSER